MGHHMQKAANIFSDPAQFKRYVLPPLLAGGLNAMQSAMTAPRGRGGLAALRGGLVGGIGGLGVVGGREAARATISDPLAAWSAGRFTGPIGGIVAYNAADSLIPQVQPLEDDAAHAKTQPKKKQKSEPKDKKDKDMNAKDKTDTKKQADSTAAIMGGFGGLVPGAVTGAGAGGLYGLASGAYQAEKGKKLRGALTGLGRGLVGGGLIGGGIGAGAGAGAGATLPHGLLSPFGAISGGLDVAADPLGTASRAALGGVGGAALGGYLGNKARKATLGEPKQDEEKSEEKNEKEDNKSEEKEERKAAGYKAAETPSHPVNNPNTKRAPMSKLEEAAVKSRMKNNPDPYGLKKKADLYGAYLGGSNLGALGGVAGAGLGGLYGLASGAYQAEKGKKLQGALRGAGRGIVGGGLLGGGTGLGMGAAMGAQIPFSDMINAVKMRNNPDGEAAHQAIMARLKNINPEMFAGLTTAGTLGGAALGGYLGDKALGGNTKDEDKEKKEAELKLAPMPGVKKPGNDKSKNLHQALEEARKKRQAEDRDFEQKAAYDSPFTTPGFYQDTGILAAGGAGLGGLYGALSAPKGKLLKNVLRNALRGGAVGAGGALGMGALEQMRGGSSGAVSDYAMAGGLGGGLGLMLANRGIDEYDYNKEQKEKEQNKTAARGDMAKKYLTEGEYHAPQKNGLRGGGDGAPPKPQKEVAQQLQNVRGREEWKSKNRLQRHSISADQRVRGPNRDRERPPVKPYAAGSSVTPDPMHYTVRDNAKVPPRESKKQASAFEFGKMIKRSDLMSGLQSVGDYAKGVWNSPGVQGFVNDPTTRAGLTYGGIGAGLGGLYGLVNPGEYEDEAGNVRRRGRLSGALRGALGGGALGGLAGAGAQEGRFQYLKHLAHQANNASGAPAAPGMGLPTDRAGWQQYAEQFAPDYLKTSPLQSAHNAYSAASNAVNHFMPKRMGSAPAAGVETPAKAPEVKTTDEQP